MGEGAHVTTAYGAVRYVMGVHRLAIAARKDIRAGYECLMHYGGLYSSRTWED